MLLFGCLIVAELVRDCQQTKDRHWPTAVRAALGRFIAANRLPAALLLLFAAIFCLVPLEGETAATAVWGLNFRYAALIGLAFVLLYPAEPPLRLRQASGIAVAVLTLLHVAALISLWQRFDRDTAQFDEILALMQPSRTLRTVVTQEAFEDAWPPLQLHTHAYYVTRGGAFDSRLFAGGHMPIRVSRTPKPPAGNDAGLGEYDYVLVQGAAHPIETGLRSSSLLGEVGRWRLYGSRQPGPTAPPTR